METDQTVVERWDYLGDRAIMAYCSSEAACARFARSVQQQNFPWLLDVVPSYFTVGVFYDLAAISPFEALKLLQQITVQSDDHLSATRHTIPCCYEMALDAERVCQHTRLSFPEVVRLHSGTIYQVYAIGFCPGFPYLGYLPAELAGIPRLESPRLALPAGSVGLTGRQTGIYPLPRPGGWNIIGQTPLCLVDVEDNYFPLSVGDQVQFQPIDRDTYEQLLGQRLAIQQVV
ncbi:MAG: allophanate hydrolase subunit 1 [Zavarzinella sp.]